MTVVVYDRNQVLVSGTETKVQFRYQYQSRNFSFLSETEIFFSKFQKTYSVPDEWATTKCGIVRKFCSDHWNEINIRNTRHKKT